MSGIDEQLVYINCPACKQSGERDEHEYWTFGYSDTGDDDDFTETFYFDREIHDRECDRLKKVILARVLMVSSSAYRSNPKTNKEIFFDIKEKVNAMQCSTCGTLYGQHTDEYKQTLTVAVKSVERLGVKFL